MTRTGAPHCRNEPKSRIHNLSAVARSSSNPSPEKPVSSVSALRGQNKKQNTSKASLGENIRAIAWTLAIFLLIRTFLFAPYRIPSGSMIPTLLVGDWLFVNKLVYGPHVPYTNFRLPGYAEPKRGDVVVFISPEQFDQPEDPHPILVKRLMAVEGDTVHMRGGMFHLNGEPQPQPAAMNENPRSDGSFTDPLFQWQKPHEIVGSRHGEPPSVPTLDDWGPLVIPEGYLFMLGDNRYNSKDGRYWGLVPRENVRGRPSFVYYSFRSGDSDRILPFLTDVRWGRIGSAIR